MLNSVVDFFFRITVEMCQLLVGEDAQSVEFLLAVRADALDDLEVVSVLLRRLTNTLEIEGLLSLLNSVDGALLFRLSLALISDDGDIPKEVDTGLAQLDSSGVSAAFVGGELSVVELEVHDHLAVFSNC